MKKQSNSILILSQKDVLAGKDPYAIDIDISYFKPDVQIEFKKADIVEYQNIGTDGTALSGQLLKDKNGTSDITRAKEQMKFLTEHKQAEEKRKNIALGIVFAFIVLFFYFINR